MQIKPQTKPEQRRYPTIGYYETHPEELARHMPVLWMRKELVAGAMAVFALGCTNKYTIPQHDLHPDITVVDTDKYYGKDDVVKAEAKCRAAPIFVHGDGSGVLGCIVANPPAFISEEDALDIIRDKFSDNDIELEKDYKAIKFQAPTLQEVDSITQEYISYFDFYNKKLNLGVIYISANDSRRLAREKITCSVWGYFPRRVANIISNRLAAQDEFNIAFFYEPLESPKYEEEENRGLFQSRAGYRYSVNQKKLEAQVEDFLEWLRDQDYFKQFEEEK